MSKYKLIAVSCWLVTGFAALLTAGLFLYNIPARGIHNVMGGLSMFAGYEPVGEFTASMSELSGLNIDWIGGKICIEPHDNSEIIITEFAKRSLKDGEDMVVSIVNGIITVKFSDKTLPFLPEKRLQVLIPRSLCSSLSQLDVGSVSGGITICDINANNYKAHSVSGRVTVSNAKSEHFFAESSSGAIDISHVSSQKMHLISISGRISVNNSVADFLITESTSGSHETSGTFTNAALSSVSGKITFICSIIPQSFVAHSTSGSVVISLPNSAEQISVSHSSVSGRFSCELPVLLLDSNARFVINQVSGSTKIITH